ncbi:hypothetical protein PISMIDRAFT_688598 [Pisolithus microcarpus 441]|uniref:Uncharacterized protein n=1 Tax=Pisolithus microcarpus 441 TaxID=765257 RepID=A0A0C9Z0L0_9AGAM|nr:hypothetical protein PISMIDRAFT_688598 [Pisolithus microcarpus 441]
MRIDRGEVSLTMAQRRYPFSGSLCLGRSYARTAALSWRMVPLYTNKRVKVPGEGTGLRAELNQNVLMQLPYHREFIRVD